MRFFFQAEDGIRDGRVTGVQTCALPISVDRAISSDRMNGFSLQWKTKVENTARNGAALSGGVVAGAGLGVTLAHLGASRSEERRVGKECRSGGSQCA